MKACRRKPRSRIRTTFSVLIGVLTIGFFTGVAGAQAKRSPGEARLDASDGGVSGDGGPSATDLPSGRSRPELRVGVAGSAPFVLQREGGAVEGLSVDVWHAVAERSGVRYSFQPVDSVDEALRQVERGALDAAIGPISITAARARQVLFTQPYFQSRVAIASRVRERSFRRALAPFLSVEFFGGLASMLAVLSLVGAALWLAERKANPEQFPAGPVRGIGNGVWLALVTMTTVGYGDRAPVTLLGKVICGTWMIVAVISATSLLAGVASAVALSHADDGRITSAAQLSGVRVAAVGGTPAEQLVRERGGRLIPVADLPSAAALVERGDVDALVFDEPQLRHYLQKNPKSTLLVAEATYLPQGYGFVFPLSATDVHQFNVSLLRAKEEGLTDRVERSWLSGVER